MAKRFGRILYATDYSKASARALDEAVALAKENDAELLVLHVIEPVTPYVTGDDYGSAELYTRLEETAKKDAQTAMQKLMVRLQKARINAKSLLVTGTAHEQIIKTARSRKADLIVIGTHGRTGLSKLFMGSIAGKVVSAAQCPVLTVRGR